MKNLILILFLLTPFFVSHAVTCNSSSTINLASAPNVLHPLRTANQNGLGICYAEQANILIKAKLPGKHDLSTIQLAMMVKKKEHSQLTIDQKKAVKKRDIKGDITNTYLDGASLCQTINSVKGEQICPTRGDRFANLTKLHPHNQEKIINTLSEFFDHNQKAGFFNSLTNRSDYQNKLDQSFKSCHLSQERFLALKNAYSRHLDHLKTTVQNRLNNPNKLTYEHMTYFNELKEIEKEIAYHSKLTAHDIFMSSEGYLNKSSYESRVHQYFKFTDKISAHLFQVRNEIQKSANELQKNEECVENKLKYYYDKACLWCSDGLGATTKDLVGLTDLGVSLLEINNALTGQLDRDAFFANIFSCEKPKVTVPSKLNCHHHDLVNRAKSYGNKRQFLDKITQEIDDKISNGVPVGINSCTRFLFRANAETHMMNDSRYTCGDKNAQTYRPNEGNHAMSIIGSRCRNGIREFLVQNSWGSGCGYYDKSYECTGRGGIWAPAETIIRNTKSYITIE